MIVTDKKHKVSVPFRKGGSTCNLSTLTGRTNHPRGAGSRLVSAVHANYLLGLPLESELIRKRTEEALAVCTAQ